MITVKRLNELEKRYWKKFRYSVDHSINNNKLADNTFFCDIAQRSFAKGAYDYQRDALTAWELYEIITELIRTKTKAKTIACERAI